MHDHYVRRQATNSDLYRALWRDLQEMFGNLFDILRGWMGRKAEEPLKSEAPQYIELEVKNLECGEDQPEQQKWRRAA